MESKSLISRIAIITTVIILLKGFNVAVTIGESLHYFKECISWQADEIYRPVMVTGEMFLLMESGPESDKNKDFLVFIFLRRHGRFSCTKRRLLILFFLSRMVSIQRFVDDFREGLIFKAVAFHPFRNVIRK